MEINRNYLLKQYQEAKQLPISHNYLQQQFADYKEIFKEIEKVVIDGDFTLGKPVASFEKKFAGIVGTKYAIGVGNGTDAIFLSLKALGIGNGDEIITTPYTFFATIGAIATTGAKPVFVDIGDDLNIDPSLIENAITPRTKVILPVHWSGMPCSMHKIMEIANKHNIHVVEDACHAIKAELNGKCPGSFGDAGCFSLHPLKNLNIWGDGGVITTDSKELYEKLILLRNHGLKNRDECAVWAYNSRLDSVQAVVAMHLLKKLDFITESRRKNAEFFDKELSKIPQIKIPRRDKDAKHVFHIYVVMAENRDRLQQHLIKNGIDARVHYPIPMHLQPAAKNLGYGEGSFPFCEEVCKSVMSLPVHEFITREQQEHVVQKIKEFFR